MGLKINACLASVCLLALATAVSPAFADGVGIAAPASSIIATAKSPDGLLQVDISLDGEGRAAYQVTRKGHLVIAPSRLGFVLTNGPKLDGKFTLGGTSSTSHDETWEQPWGERRFVRDHYNEVRVDLVQPAYDNRKITVVFRIFDDGVGFRYEFPDQAQLHDVKISEELTEFALVDKATALWALGGELSNLEYLYKQTPLDEVSQAQTPMTIKTEDGTYIAFHEAALAVDGHAIHSANKRKSA